jgi:hypothetical protein
VGAFDDMPSGYKDSLTDMKCTAYLLISVHLDCDVRHAAPVALVDFAKVGMFFWKNFVVAQASRSI